MSGPIGDGELRTYGSEELFTEHEPISDDAYRPSEPITIRVLAVSHDLGRWSVESAVEEIADGVDPTQVRFVIEVEGDAFEHDIPPGVLQDLAKKIGEL